MSKTPAIYVPDLNAYLRVRDELRNYDARCVGGDSEKEMKYIVSWGGYPFKYFELKKSISDDHVLVNSVRAFVEFCRRHPKKSSILTYNSDIQVSDIQVPAEPILNDENVYGVPFELPHEYANFVISTSRISSSGKSFSLKQSHINETDSISESNG